MRLSKKRINKTVELQLYNLFYQVIADLRSTTEAKAFLEGILSKTELEALVKRLGVARLLDQGQSYEEIKKMLKVSSATVATIAEQMKKEKGFEVALKKIRAHQWAGKWAKKISQIINPKANK
ncbi:Trp family transcriptional regulator [Patescibacteria group bacterium]